MKVFLTVGSVLPFDRLVRYIDHWMGLHPEMETFAQIGLTHLEPTNFKSCRLIDPSEYRSHIVSSDLIVSHAGMGTVITAVEYNKPLVMLPRRPEFKEVTSSHQIATARWLEGRPGIRIAYEEEDLAQAISDSIRSPGAGGVNTGTRMMLIDNLQCFLSE